MVLDPIPQSLPVHFFGSRPQPPTSPGIINVCTHVRPYPFLSLMCNVVDIQSICVYMQCRFDSMCIIVYFQRVLSSIFNVCTQVNLYSFSSSVCNIDDIQCMCVCMQRRQHSMYIVVYLRYIYAT